MKFPRNFRTGDDDKKKKTDWVIKILTFHGNENDAGNASVHLGEIVDKMKIFRENIVGPRGCASSVILQRAYELPGSFEDEVERNLSNDRGQQWKFIASSWTINIQALRCR